MINESTFITSKIYAKTFHMKFFKTTRGEDEGGGGGGKKKVRIKYPKWKVQSALICSKTKA